MHEPIQANEKIHEKLIEFARPLVKAYANKQGIDYSNTQLGREEQEREDARKTDEQKEQTGWVGRVASAVSAQLGF